MVSHHKQWPKPGDRLFHKSRKLGQIFAEVLSVNQETGKISVKVKEHIYGSLSAAARSVTGNETDGWSYWGLKPKHSRQDRDNPAG